MSRYRVDIIESERGWGQKIDESLFFDTLTAAQSFVTNYNKDNNLPAVPDWYMYASTPVYISDEQEKEMILKKLKGNK
jgi:hypothetical protein